MNVFTEVYEKSVDLLKTPALDKSWTTIEAGLKALLEAEGPNVAKAKALDDLRDHLKKAAHGKPVAKSAIADEIVKACKTGAAGFQDRAALIKTMQHFHLVRAKGAQSIWVVDPPKAFTTWPYDALAGKSAPEIKVSLEAEAEVFGSRNRSMISDALQLARKWVGDLQAQLGRPDAKTLDKVKRWFHTEGASKDDVAATVAALLDGLQKIHAVCNPVLPFRRLRLSPTPIVGPISRPIWRAS